MFIFTYSLIIYGSVIWTPLSQNGINRLHKIQYKVICFLAYKSSNSMAPWLFYHGEEVQPENNRIKYSYDYQWSNL